MAPVDHPLRVKERGAIAPRKGRYKSIHLHDFTIHRAGLSAHAFSISGLRHTASTTDSPQRSVEPDGTAQPATWSLNGIRRHAGEFVRNWGIHLVMSGKRPINSCVTCWQCMG